MALRNHLDFLCSFWTACGRKRIFCAAARSRGATTSALKVRHVTARGERSVTPGTRYVTAEGDEVDAITDIKNKKNRNLYVFCFCASDFKEARKNAPGAY